MEPTSWQTNTAYSRKRAVLKKRRERTSQKQNISSSIENREFQDPENLFNLVQDPELAFRAMDLNAKISNLEQTLLDITQELDSTNKSFRSALEDVDSKNKTISNEVGQTHEQLKGLDGAFRMLQEQTSDLTAKAQQLASDLDHSAATSNSAIETMGQELSAKSNALEQELGQAEKAIKSNASNIQGMQSLEQDLDRRSRETNQATMDLDKQAQKLDKRTRKLEATADSLEQLGQHLLQAVADVGEKTGDLKHQIHQQDRRITALSILEHRHFRFFGISLMLTLLAIGAVFTQQRNDMQSIRSVDLELVQQISQQAVGQTTLQGQQLEQSSQALAMVEDIQTMEQKIAKLNNRFQGIDDQTQSLASRVTSLAPHRKFGSDNIIHGPTWLEQQPEQNYAILLATVSRKQELYQVADHYGRFLKREISYIEITGGSSQYVMIYGNFADRQQALSELYQLPMQIQHLEPSVDNIGNILKL